MCKNNSMKVLVLFFSFSILLSSCSLFKNSETAELRKELEELKKNKTENAEKTDDPNTPNREKTKKTVKMSSGYLTMRNEPDAKTGKLIAKIPNGAEVLVGDCQKESVKIGGREGHWCQVTYKDQDGWAFDAFLVEEGKTKDSSNNKANYLITAKSAGDIRFGMTIAEARKVLKGAKFTRDMGDGEGVIISVDQGGKSLMYLYADEGKITDIETAPIVESAKIEGIDIFDSRYKTADGVHCGMTVSDAEKRFGKLKNIWTEGLTGNELATFSRHPKGFNFWIAPRDGDRSNNNTAGIYGEKDPDNTTRYKTGAIISMISIPVYD